jgi:MinD-like ATPase involved in chromosome partitioning or flagellar assembly
MSERDFFDQLGAAPPPPAGQPQPNHPQSQLDPDVGQHQRPPGKSDEHSDTTPPKGLPMGELNSDEDRRDESPPAAAPDSAAARAYDDLTQEIPRHVREDAQRNAGAHPPAGQRPRQPHHPQELGRQWRPAPSRRQPRVAHEVGGTGGSAVPGPGSGELLGEQVRATDLVEAKKIPSSRGWRKWVYRLTFRAINPGESADEQLVRSMRNQIASPLAGTFSAVVLGGKGGVGKTSATVAIGSTFAALRPREQVIAVDADPGQGANLAVRIDRNAASSYNDIVAANDLVRYSDMRARVGHNAIGLDVLASPAHRAATAQTVITAELYLRTRRRLERFYNILLTDCGVDVQHPVMEGVLTHADALVMVTSAMPDGAEGAAKQMDWLSNHPRYRHVLDRMVLVINHIRAPWGRRDRKATDNLVATLVERFGRWVPAERIIVVPFDWHIAAAGVIDLDEMDALTRRRFLEVSAALATGFPATTGTL